jgi:hypothetical protein
MDGMDFAIWYGFLVALALAMFGLDELYEWLVEPFRHHTLPFAALPDALASSRGR